MEISRRGLLQGALATSVLAVGDRVAAAGPARVFVVKGRIARVRWPPASTPLRFTACDERAVAIKANFNSGDAFPASTHPATLRALLGTLKSRRATQLTLAERSGMGDTRNVLTSTGAVDVVKDAGAQLVVLDEVEREGWAPMRGAHWPNGFHAARVFTDAPCVVQTMCCKTHRFGGHVTLSLKNTVGLVAKTIPGDGHNYMRDLHRSEHQRAMIAEANLAWRPALSVMDCLEAFVDGGPEAGRRAAPGVFLASEDRCALDAAAIALLRLHGMTGPAARGPIGETAQLARAIALGVGQPPASVAVVPVEPSARDVAQRIGELLARG